MPTEGMKALNYILARLSESSSWRGIILILVAAGIRIDPEIQEGILAAGLSAVGLINLLRKEK
jgi:pimeloyl-CoA synthetase